VRSDAAELDLTLLLSVRSRKRLCYRASRPDAQVSTKHTASQRSVNFSKFPEQDFCDLMRLVAVT
jgi:hypothetical protein